PGHGRRSSCWAWPPRSSSGSPGPTSTPRSADRRGRRRRAAGAGAAEPARGRSGQQVHEALELAEVAALVHAVAARCVPPDVRVAGVPVALRLGVEEVEVSCPLAELLKLPALRGLVVVPRVGEQDGRRLEDDFLA